MPMIDYRCDKCSYRFENFYHSDPPESQTCPAIECDGVSRRVYSLPGEYRPTNAQRFDPIVVWVSDTDPGKVSIPPRSNEPVDPGYHRVELKTISEAAKFAKKIDNDALKEAVNRRYAEREYWDAVTRERRESILARIGNDSRLLSRYKEVCKRIDERRERRYSKTLNPNTHFQVVEFDSSNRMPYADVDTNWRDRKV